MLETQNHVVSQVKYTRIIVLQSVKLLTTSTPNCQQISESENFHSMKKREGGKMKTLEQQI